MIDERTLERMDHDAKVNDGGPIAKHTSLRDGYGNTGACTVITPIHPRTLKPFKWNDECRQRRGTLTTVKRK